MDIGRFQEIVEHNRSIMNQTTRVVKAFCDAMDINYYERKNFDNLFLRDLAHQKNIFSFYVPMKNKEVGACCYHNEKMKYILVNSAIPRANMNFAFSHELYHAFSVEKDMTAMDIFLNDGFGNEEDERKANAFAGVFLMPDTQVKRLWEKLKDEKDVLRKVLRISAFFGTPYVATLIRLTEINCLDQETKLVEELLAVNKEMIRESYEELSLEKSLLEPTWEDNYRGILYIVDGCAKRLVEEGYFKETDIEFYKSNLQQLYLNIREEKHVQEISV